MIPFVSSLTGKRERNKIYFHHEIGIGIGTIIFTQKFCDGATSAAMSSQSPIDGEEMIITKTEEIPSSSTKNSTRVKMKKEEDEVVDDNSNNDDTSASTRASSMNSDLNRPVKKEEDNVNDAKKRR
jgi:hypothetical protein